MLKTSGRRRALVMAATVVALVIVGAAVAAWVISQSGVSGRGTIGTLQSPTIANPATVTGVDCWPGQTCAFQVSITNPNNVPLTLTGITFSGSSITVEKPLGTTNAGCTSSVTINNLSGLSIPIPAGTTTVTVPGAYTLASSAPTGCQGSYVFYNSSTGSNWTFST